MIIASSASKFFNLKDTRFGLEDVQMCPIRSKERSIWLERGPIWFAKCLVWLEKCTVYFEKCIV